MYKILSYASCNISTIISFSVVFTLMVITIIIMKLFIDGEIYKDVHGCWPISFYFGDTNGCKRLIYDSVKSDHFHDTGNAEGFKTISNIPILPFHYDFTEVVLLVIKNLIKNLIKLMNMIFYEITSLGIYILEINESIKSFIYQFAKEKLSFIYIYS